LYLQLTSEKKNSNVEISSLPYFLNKSSINLLVGHCSVQTNTSFFRKSYVEVLLITNQLIRDENVTRISTSMSQNNTRSLSTAD